MTKSNKSNRKKGPAPVPGKTAASQEQQHAPLHEVRSYSGFPRLSSPHIHTDMDINNNNLLSPQTEEQQNSERNQFSTRTNELIRMLAQHNADIGVKNKINVNLKHQEPDGDHGAYQVDTNSQTAIVDDDFYSRDEFARTTSMVSTGPGEVQAMSQQYKMVTSGVLWFSYFSLVSLLYKQLWIHC